MNKTKHYAFIMFR